MNRIFFAVMLVAAVSISAARADEPQPACTVTGSNLLSQDSAEVSISCSGLSEAQGKLFADILTRILQNRLDPQVVMAKLEEVDRLPQEGAARTVDDVQRQSIIQNLIGKPVQQIGITAHLAVDDSADFAKAIATPLLMVGWQIDGHQIRRAAPKALDPVQGVAIVVRDGRAPPDKAKQLREALAKAHITAVLVSDPAMPADTANLWIGRRPGSPPPETK